MGEQKPCSSISGGGNTMPLSPAPMYSPAPPYNGRLSANPFADGTNGGMAELPGQRPHQELPDSTRPHYAELG